MWRVSVDSTYTVQVHFEIIDYFFEVKKSCWLWRISEKKSILIYAGRDLFEFGNFKILFIIENLRKTKLNFLPTALKISKQN